MDKEFLRVQYELLVRLELNKVKFNINIHIEVMKAILSTVVAGFFFAWCSSSEESFLQVSIRENEWVRIVICCLPVFFALLYDIAIVIAAINRRKRIDFDAEMTSVYWRKIYKKFVLGKIGCKKGENYVQNMTVAKKIFKNHEDVCFYEDEFSDYLQEYYLKYRLDLSFEFYKNLAKVILLENEINGTLISEETGRYVFVVKDNIEFISMFCSGI